MRVVKFGFKHFQSGPIVYPYYPLRIPTVHQRDSSLSHDAVTSQVVTVAFAQEP